MKKLLLILAIVFILSGCMSMMGMKSVKVNSIPAIYSDHESIEYGKVATIQYRIAEQSNMFADTYDIWLKKTLTNNTTYYSLNLDVYRVGWLFLEEFKMRVDDELFTFKDPDPNRDVFSGSTISEKLSTIIDEDIIKRIANTKSPILFQYKTSDPIVIEGGQLEKVKQYAEGLLTINSISDLGM